MIVCICKVVTDRQVDAAVEQGASSVDEVSARTGAGTDCGCCQDDLEQRVSRACARLARGACGGCTESLAVAV
jgi:bacterioferritin-associated ferredoxin